MKVPVEMIPGITNDRNKRSQVSNINNVKDDSDLLNDVSLSARGRGPSSSLSEDIQSLNSWSENLCLSTSSSSESGSRPGSASSRRGSGSQHNKDSKSKARRLYTRNTYAKEYKIPSWNAGNHCPIEYSPESSSSARNSNKNSQGAISKSRATQEGEDSLYEAELAFADHKGYEVTGEWEVLNDFPDVAHSESSQHYDHVLNSKSKAVKDNTRFPSFNHGTPAKTKGGTISTINNTQPSLRQSAQSNLYPNLDEMYLEMPTDPGIGMPVTQYQSASVSLPSPQSSVGSSSQTSQRPKLFDYYGKNTSTKFKSQLRTAEQPSAPSSSQRRNVSSQEGGSLSRLFKSQPSMAALAKDAERLPKSSSDLASMKYEHRLEPDNVKTKLMSAWNNIKYGWTFKSKSSMKYDSPLYMLGRIYHRRKDNPEDESENDFLRDFASRIWLTYRSNFYPIPGTKFSTDCGWGCMLRSGQMLIAQCLITHFLGRDWRLYNPQTETQMTFYREIIRWFSDPVDSPSDKTPFSLHHMAHFGRKHNKDPGEWYGPSSVAYIFRDAFAKASDSIPILSQLCLYVAQDCTVYMEDVHNLCTFRNKSESVSGSWDSESVQRRLSSASSAASSEGTWLRSVIILIPMRLGGEILNEIYIPCVKKLLSQPNCMGIIGGKPKHSLYFLGWQEDKLIYLDPHYCRDAIDTSVKDFRIETFHCLSPRKLPIVKMDPSCTVGFYIKDAADFQKFVDEVREVASPHQAKTSYPMFIFNEGSHKDAHQSFTDQDLHKEQGRVRVTHYYIDEHGQRKRTDTRESEEFIML